MCVHSIYRMETMELWKFPLLTYFKDPWFEMDWGMCDFYKRDGKQKYANSSTISYYNKMQIRSPFSCGKYTIWAKTFSNSNLCFELPLKLIPVNNYKVQRKHQYFLTECSDMSRWLHYFISFTNFVDPPNNMYWGLLTEKGNGLVSTSNKKIIVFNQTENFQFDANLDTLDIVVYSEFCKGKNCLCL